MTPRWIWEGKVPTLDGLRGVSIVMVGIHHYLIALGRGGTGILGYVGVDIFFAISGFIITLLLLREHRRTATISLSGFYARRATRILPAYATYLFVLATIPHVVPLQWDDWLALLTFTVNFTDVPWEVSHLWSLCVEEHFYLLWPLVLSRLGPRQGWRAAVVCMLIAPLFRVAVVAWAPETFDLGKCTPSRIDTIAAGCCLGYLATDPVAFRRVQLSPRTSVFLAGVLGSVLIASKAALVTIGDVYMIVYPSINAISVAGLVWLCVTHADGPVGCVLQSKPLVGLGVLSYSLYLWHKLFITPDRSDWMTSFPINIALTLLVALTSYFVVEQPLLRLRRRSARGSMA